MRSLLAFACCSVSCTLTAQQIGITGQVGYGIGESDRSKKVMLVNEVILTTSFNLDGLYSLVAGAGAGSIKYGSGTGVPDVFNTKVFLLLPLGIRRSFPLSARSAAVLGLDIVGTFLISDKFEVRNAVDPGTFLRKAEGRSLALAGTTGYRYSITTGSLINIGFVSSEDLIQHFPDPERKIGLQKWMFALTFSTFLKKKLVLKTFKKL